MVLEVVTRTCKRPQMLAVNQASLARQSDGAWCQTLLIDDVGVGVGAANARLAAHRAAAQWVWVLDDDDVCAYPLLVEDIRTIGQALPAVSVIMVRMDHGSELGVLPADDVWQQSPKEGRLGCSSFIVRRDVWERNRHAWASGRYAADYDFIAAVWAEGPTVFWHDVIASRCQRGRMIGAPE